MVDVDNLNLFVTQGVMPSTVVELLLAWRFGIGSKRGWIMWRSSLMVVVWSLWKERNGRYFDGSIFPVVQLGVDRAKFLVASWV